jgi:hypothetical protein
MSQGVHGKEVHVSKVSPPAITHSREIKVKTRLRRRRRSPELAISIALVTIDSSLPPEKRDQNKSFINLNIIEDLIYVYRCLICARVPVQFAPGSTRTPITSFECRNGHISRRRRGPPSRCRRCLTTEIHEFVPEFC